MYGYSLNTAAAAWRAATAHENKSGAEQPIRLAPSGPSEGAARSGGAKNSSSGTPTEELDEDGGESLVKPSVSKVVEVYDDIKIVTITIAFSDVGEMLEQLHDLTRWEDPPIPFDLLLDAVGDIIWKGEASGDQYYLNVDIGINPYTGDVESIVPVAEDASGDPFVNSEGSTGPIDSAGEDLIDGAGQTSEGDTDDPYGRISPVFHDLLRLEPDVADKYTKPKKEKKEKGEGDGGEDDEDGGGNKIIIWNSPWLRLTEYSDLKDVQTFVTWQLLSSMRGLLGYY